MRVTIQLVILMCTMTSIEKPTATLKEIQTKQEIYNTKIHKQYIDSKKQKYASKVMFTSLQTEF